MVGTSVVAVNQKDILVCRKKMLLGRECLKNSVVLGTLCMESVVNAPPVMGGCGQKK